MFLKYFLKITLFSDGLDAGQCQGVELRGLRVAARGQHHGAHGAAQYAGTRCAAEERDGLIEHVAGLYVGEDDGVSLAFQRRVDALLMQCLSREAGLQVEWSVDDAAAELALLHAGYELAIFYGVGEILLVDLLGAVNQTDTGLFYAHGMAGLHHILQLLHALLGRGMRNDGRVGEEKEAILARNLGTGEVGQHTTLGQDARLFVEHGMQQVVGIEQTLLQHIGLTLAHQCDGLAGGIVGVGGLYILHARGVILGKDGLGFLGASHQNCIHKTLVDSTAYGILRRLIVRTNYCHTALVGAAAQMGY